jgi:hypothetical protein
MQSAAISGHQRPDGSELREVKQQACIGNPWQSVVISGSVALTCSRSSSKQSDARPAKADKPTSINGGLPMSTAAFPNGYCDQRRDGRIRQLHSGWHSGHSEALRGTQWHSIAPIALRGTL